MDKIRWGILGTSRIAQQELIPAIRQASNADLVAVASRSLKAAELYASENGIDKFYGSYEELLEDEDIDAVYIPLPNHLHKPWTIKAAQAGKHVLCEKPAALNADEAREMTEICRQHGVVFMEAFMYQFHPQWRKVQDVIESGEIGVVKLIRSTFSHLLDREGDVRWNPEMGGGALYDLGCYCVHVTRHLAGNQLPKHIHAVAQKTDRGVDLTTVGVLEFDSGLLAHFDCSFGIASRQFLEVVGTEGTIQVNLPFRPDSGVPLVRIQGKGGNEDVSFEPGWMFRSEVEHFGECVKNHSVPKNSSNDTLINMQIIDQILKASTTTP